MREFIDRPTNDASESGTGFRTETGFRSFIRKIPNYCVIISFKKRRKDAIVVNLEEKELLETIINPLKEGSKFGFGNELVYPEEIKRIKITETEHLVMAAEYGDRWNEANCGKDVTSKYLKENIFAEANDFTKEMDLKKRSVSNNKIFIVHGKDSRPVKELKELLTKLGLKPVVLHEQPSGSRTIVEKLEKYSKVGYAFVILTPDDIGVSFQDLFEKTAKCSYDDEALGAAKRILEQSGGSIERFIEFNAKFMQNPEDATQFLQFLFPRARQNVVLEFGYFIGLLGRDKVCCLLKGNVEKPSDMDGIVYVPFSNTVNEVKEKIIRELEAAGYKLKTKSV